MCRIDLIFQKGELMITMVKNRSRNFFIKTARFKSKILLKLFKTCDLVAELERRKDVCTTIYVEPHRFFYIDANNEQHAEIADDGPAVILVVVD